MGGRSRVGAGVVWRQVDEVAGRVEVLVVHRRRQRDWVLPKGRAKKSELLRSAAVREVREETGWTCTPIQKLCAVARFGADDTEHFTEYWEMVSVGDRGEAADREVDRQRWLTVSRAQELLDSAGDRYALSWFATRHNL